MFSQMDKFQRWVISRGVAWARMIRLLSSYDPKVDTHMASGQRIFIVDNSVEHKCDKICYASNFGNHYRKSCCKDVVFALS
jgi:hypothetical protein